MIDGKSDATRTNHDTIYRSRADDWVKEAIEGKRPMVMHDSDEGIQLVQLRAFHVTGKGTHQRSHALAAVQALLRGDMADAKREATMFQDSVDTFEEIGPV